MFTVEQRDALLDRMMRVGEQDERVAAGAIVGSLAVEAGDRFSDLDLTFAIADHIRVVDVLGEWTRALVGELGGVVLVDLERGATVYRVFLLPDALQLDLSMPPPSEFRPAGPRFRLVFGEIGSGGPTPVREACSSRRPRSRGTSSGGASSTRFTRAHASNAIVSGRRSITSARCAIMHSRLPASVKARSRCRRAGTTPAPVRPVTG